jgi:cobalt-zinc-cadmium efflux system protein
MRGNARLFGALALSLLVAAVEVVGSISGQSLGLLADAVHAGTDSVAIVIMLLASYGASRPANRRKTYGYGRVEVLASVFNGALLLGITGVIAYGAVQRFAHPVHPRGDVMAYVSAFALCGNITAGWLLSRSAAVNLNVRSAFLHVAGDAMGSFSVMVAGILIALTHDRIFDPLFTLVVAAIVVVGVAFMLREALDILLEAVPKGLSIREVERAMASVAGVDEIHELHLWTIGLGANALSAHVMVADRSGGDALRVLRDVRSLVREKFDITHVTLQVEAEHCAEEGQGRVFPAR